MDPLEIAGGWVFGYDPLPLPPGPHPHPREALDRVLRRCLLRTPCVIAFSGGRDSSALLAAAVTVARREGLPLPVAITMSYPDVADADETEWQRQVLDHLGVVDRVVISVRDEHDPLGPIAAPLLRSHGVMWPPNFAPIRHLMDSARGGALLTGEGGDEIFGIKRITPLTKLVRSRGRGDRRLYPMAVRALAPRRVRRREVGGVYRPPWLREAVQEQLVRMHAEDLAETALHSGHHAWQLAVRTGTRRGYETLQVLGAEVDVEHVQPFHDPGFVAAYAAVSGFWGWPGRTSAMRHLFDDVLPRAVLERQTKALFNNAVFTERTRGFAREWDGSGVDADLVDPDALREHWLSPVPHGPSMLLLQQAWLAADAGASIPG
ncbi:asparagine synthase C-terminal domain-containing protein [Pseudonocardia sp.]|uniref:asparagine synthase C-terminal domain-containing protein n=1 Tax=Pseudonocardia sp. TaxID=60912 RepID=UPI002628D5D5|nr:asparagine synthase C-terminal domain-containing protein [Pseudonocardia sp.]